MIRLAAQVITDCANPQRDFVGHVGGDDFVVIFQSPDWLARCRQIVDTFNTKALTLYDPQDRHGIEAGGDVHLLDTGWAWTITGERNSTQANGSSAQGGAGLPGQDTEGGEIGPEFEIAETRFPIGDLEAFQRVHLEVDGEQIIAAVRAVLGNRIQEQLGAKAFAHEAAKRVGDGDDYGVNLSGANLLRELFERYVMNLMSEIMAHTITLHLLDAPGRVHRFRRKHPEMFNRVPQKELAAYLNLTAETLSRLKQRGKI